MSIYHRSGHSKETQRESCQCRSYCCCDPLVERVEKRAELVPTTEPIPLLAHVNTPSNKHMLLQHIIGCRFGLEHPTRGTGSAGKEVVHMVFQSVQYE
jgi:hypothetical protein